MGLNYTYKSLEGKFPRPLTPTSRRKPSPFGKTWTQILDDLERELRNLNYRYGSCVLMTAHQPYDVRNDGQLRRDARRPEHPGVVVKFDVYDRKNSRYVPMSFECDQFNTFDANLQAVVGAMEALRKVDRYGVTGGGKSNAHYEGYKALPPQGSTMFADEAARFVSQHSGLAVDGILGNADIRAKAFKQAALKLHPDVAGGSHELFLKLSEARKAIEAEASP